MPGIYNDKMRIVQELVPGKQITLAQDVYKRQNNLCNMGVEFAVASGRTYHELEKMFFPVYGRITFLCNNGGVIIRNRRVMFQMPFDRLDVLTFAQKVRDEFGVNVILYGAKSSYYIGEDPAFIRKDVYKRQTIKCAACLPHAEILCARCTGSKSGIWCWIRLCRLARCGN